MSCLFHWPRGLKHGSAVARLWDSGFESCRWAWMSVCCECCVLSGRGLCNELITRPEESYRLCCVVVCDLETSRIGAPYIYIYIYIHDISSLRVNQLLYCVSLKICNKFANYFCELSNKLQIVIKLFDILLHIFHTRTVTT